MESIEKLQQEFVTFAEGHYAAILQGDSKSANKNHKKLTTIYKKIKSIKQEDILLSFLNHHNEGVRLWAAASLLKYNTELALNCLNKLTLLPTIIATDAKMVLELCQKGELELL